MVKGLALTDRVHQCGFVAASDLPSVYAGATAFAYPSLYEGFGLPVLEAMACGVPVVVSEGSSLMEVAAQAGIAAPSQDADAWAGALERVLTDGELAGRLGEMGRARAQGFTWERTARETAAVYDRVLSARGAVSVGVHHDPA
jgi:alpha-1,3-rhamnosyl/mannosyltransferase